MEILRKRKLHVSVRQSRKMNVSSVHRGRKQERAVQIFHVITETTFIAGQNECAKNYNGQGVIRKRNGA